jgi:predicted glycogen debranching enzyme
MERVAVESLGFEGLIQREWLNANALGGYSSSTICGMNTRKYHGLLVAAMAPPVRRMVILSRVDETVTVDNGVVDLACNEYPETIHPQGYKFLRAFNPEPFPRWAYQADGFTLEKSVRILSGENTVCVSYTLLAGDKPVALELRPLLAMRPIHELMYQWNGRLKAECREEGRVRIGATARTPEVFLAHDGVFDDTPAWYLNTIYRREQERGYAGLEDLWMPGVVRRTLLPGETLHVACSMEKIDLDRVVSLTSRPPRAVDSPDKDLADLERAAAPHVLSVDSAGHRAAAVITHYPWSSPSLRGAFISTAGLLLVPGRFDEARSLLESAAALVDGGLIPSELPEDSSPPVYHGADVSLWYVNAVWQYLNYAPDEGLATRLLGVLDEIIESYRRGTRLGIIADQDGLISTSAIGIPTTWMDAKLVDHVITPRRGRPVEINALWYNALRIVADLHRQTGHASRAGELNDLAEWVQQSFNRRFWNEQQNCLYDVVTDHDSDASVRPNQIFAASLPHPVLWPSRYEAVIEVVINELLTPFGLRTLSPRDPAYQGRYGGNVIQRDRAYHNGSAYPWLLGPLATAIIRTRGRNEEPLNLVRQILSPALTYIRGDGLGLICELFDGDAPHRPGGSLASAPAAAELARAWAEDMLAIPGRRSASEHRSTPVAAQ